MRGRRIGPRLIELQEDLPHGAEEFEVRPLSARTSDELEEHLRMLEAAGEVDLAPDDAPRAHGFEPVFAAPPGAVERFLEDRR